MLKRRLFLLFYILILTIIPVCVYHFQPVTREETGEDQMMDSADIAMMDGVPDSTGVPDSAVIKPLQDPAITVSYGMPMEIVETMTYEARFNHALKAGFFMFVFSLICTLIISIVSVMDPGKQFGKMITVLCILNFFYIPFVMTLATLNPRFPLQFYFYTLPGFMENVYRGTAIVIAMSVIFLVTIILGIIGVVLPKKSD